LLSFYSAAQNDTLVSTNGDVIIGELTSMNKGVLKFDTDYADSDFSIKWEKVQSLRTQREFVVATAQGNQYEGRFYMANPQEAIVFKGNDTLIKTTSEDIVFIKGVESEFIDRVSAAVSFGYNFTKSNNSRQFSLRSNLGYEANKWSVNASYNGIASQRDDAETVRRTDASLSYRYFLNQGWFVMNEANLLSNTEQNIELRIISQSGMGKYLIRSNRMRWSLVAGLSYNNESFTDAAITSQNSLEGLVSTAFNSFDLGDLSLSSKIDFYPSITESGRVRVDGTTDIQYNLPLNLFIKLGITANYDNNAVVRNSALDYVFISSFGWKL
jgi:hypothetical protein